MKAEMSVIPLAELKELIRMRKENPDEYKEFLKDAGETLGELLDALGPVIAKASAKMAMEMVEAIDGEG